MTCSGKQLAGKANLHSTEEGPPYRSRISWWTETPPVIGVKENVALVCHEVFCGTHSTSLTQLSVICLLNHSNTHVLSLFFLPSAPMPSCPLFHSWLHLKVLLLSVWQQRADLMAFSCWWGRVCQSCAPALSCSRLRDYSSGLRRQLQLQNATEGFRVSLNKHGYKAQHKAPPETLMQV